MGISRWQSKINGVDVFLFEVVKEKEYIYMGQVMLCGVPYQEDQPGEDGALRRVWIFSVILKENEKASLISEELAKERKRTTDVLIKQFYTR